jgi:hypothetical protein
MSLVLFIALQWMDFLTTICAFRLGGYEANPVVAAVLPLLSPVGGVFAIKVFAVAAMLHIKSKPLIYAGNIYYLGVVLWNTALLMSVAK